ncbi:hypothetical protein KSP39_PZI014594 [Platanthera zijinensis]|uniref:Phytocyanin domain-containing protein n=1 Tax=Platanthera zijinensis TaxID=2320716 RepID=A0AAP0BAX0_9ASPA
MAATFFLALALIVLISDPASPTTTDSLRLDDLTGRRSIILSIGDSILFKRSDHLQNVYLFRSQKAFDLCNFADAYLIFPIRSAQIKWTPAPWPSQYYFSTKNESAQICKKGENVLLIRVILPPSIENAPPPTAGGDLPSSTSGVWWASAGKTPPPSLAPEASPGVPSEGDSSSPAEQHSGEGIPFINSNPAVPLPTGETDTAALRPQTAAEGTPQVVGQGALVQIHMLHVTVTVIMSWIFMC